MTFEVFSKANTRGRAVTVRVSRTGQLTLSAAALRGMGRPTHVELLFDLPEKKFALRAADDEMRAFRVRGAGQVSGAAFVKRIDLAPGLYEGQVVDGLVVFDWKRPT